MDLAKLAAMLHLLAALALALSAADHWTTYLCLHSPVSGFEVTEANPLAAWLFQSVGLVEGLMIDSLLTIVALAFLITTRWMPRNTGRNHHGRKSNSSVGRVSPCARRLRQRAYGSAVPPW